MPETMNEINQQTAAVETHPKQGQAQPEVKPQEDIVSRANKVKLEPVKKDDGNPFGLVKEDYDKITNDPVLSKFYKSMQSDYVKKTQQVAEERKQYEALKQEQTKWTPEKVKLIVNDPNFVQAAQSVVQSQAPDNWTGSQEAWSALNDKEKQEFVNLRKEVDSLKQQQYFSQVKTEDERLKAKYANYAPDIVDTTIHKLQNKEIVATREDLWKVIDYESAMERAYKIGLEDRNLNEKLNATSFEGISNQTQRTQIEPQKGESNNAYLKRVFLENISKLKGQNRT